MFRLRSLLLGLSLLVAACGGGGGGDGGGGSQPPSPAQIQVAIVPTTVELASSATHQFTCTVTGSTNTQCTWNVEGGTANGTITAAGLYTAPAVAGAYQVRATSAADASRSATAAVTVTAPTTANRPWVTGYYAGYDWHTYEPHLVDMTAMTHFVFARVAPGGGTLGGAPGTVQLGAVSAQEHDGSPYGAQTVEQYAVSRAHDAGAKALLMVGGAGDGEGFYLSTANNIRPTFVRRLVDYMVAQDYDGIDVDWEDDLSEPNDRNIPQAEARRRLMALIRDLRTEANSRPRYQGAGRQVVITFPWYPKNINFLETGGKVEQWEADVANMVDQFNLMSYGIGTAYDADGWQSWLSGPIYGATPSTPYDLDTSVRAYVATGVPRSKIGIGIGLFGIYYTPDIQHPRQNLNANTRLILNDVPLAYNELHKLGFLTRGNYTFNSDFQVGYRSYPGGYNPAGWPDSVGMLSYENEQSIRAKGAWVRNPATAVGGTIIWTINYGWLPNQTNPLMDEVKRSFLQ